MKRTPLRSRSKTPAAKLKRKADALWSLAIRSAGACAMGEYCLAKKPDPQLHAHHILGKQAHPRHRWSLQNGICLCATDHVMGNRSAHRDPHCWDLWLAENRPEQHAWVREHRADTGKVDVKETIEFLEETLALMGVVC